MGSAIWGSVQQGGSPSFNDLTVTDDLTVTGDAAVTGVISTRGGQKLVEYFETAVIDFLTLGATATVAKARPGYYAVYITTASGRALFVTRDAPTTLIPNFKMGTNGAHDNFVTGITTGTTTVINATAAPAQGVLNLPTAVVSLVELTADLVIEVSQAATGPTAFTGRLIIPLMFVPV